MSNWFYIQRWRQRAWDSLLEHRKIRVCWDTDGIDQREILPQFVKIPEGIQLDNESVSKWLSDTYDWCVSDWYVAHTERK